MTEPVKGMPATRSYKEADLRPTAKDPQCDPEFPLANYWPVYFGNFWCNAYADHVPKIQKYFGSKGLLVRMIFGRNEKDDPYFVEQQRIKCYDFLVYFVSQQDAQDAATYCHREKYHGHRLNVLSGRTPELFDESKSAKYALLHPRQAEIAEEIFERVVFDTCKARINYIVKHSDTHLLVEYCSTGDRTKAVQHCKIAVPELISSDQIKQRFLERDVLKELTELTKRVSFMDMLPPSTVLHPLLNGTVPPADIAWKTDRKVPRIGKMDIGQAGKSPAQKRVFTEARKKFEVEGDKQHGESAAVKVAKMTMAGKKDQQSMKKKRRRADRCLGKKYLCF